MNRSWWKSLNDDWKNELMSNLLINNDNGCFFPELITIFQTDKLSDRNIAAIQTLSEIHITSRVLYDLSPLNKLSKLKHLHIEAKGNDYPEIKGLLKMIPHHLSVKVNSVFFEDITIGEDCSVLSRFYNIESLHLKACNIKSLKGIQNLKKLQTLAIPNNQFPLYLRYLVGLPLKTLMLENTPINNLNPLHFIRTLNCLMISSLTDIADYWTLSGLRKIELIINGEYVEQTLSNLETILKKETKGKVTNSYKQQLAEVDIANINTTLLLDNLHTFLPLPNRYN
ncbi:hypothetical protein [uncultured Draconibacterium sp.]|uniref:hypothetical protein n=1 Tax=uncultured Draconibacterium sp. TaxID=1573823 RepID=UPI0025DAE6FD|nr:hypothetical protein [uncultured Draconibacterium sp.]